MFLRTVLEGNSVARHRYRHKSSRQGEDEVSGRARAGLRLAVTAAAEVIRLGEK